MLIVVGLIVNLISLFVYLQHHDCTIIFISGKEVVYSRCTPANQIAESFDDACFTTLYGFSSTLLRSQCS